MDLNTVIAIGGLMVTILGAVWTQGLWISRQFSILKDFVNDKVDGVLNKLEYHERHDDQRFANVNDNIWGLRLDNAQDPRFKRHQAAYPTDKIPDFRSPPKPPPES